MDKAIENAVVILFEMENPCNPCSLRAISHTSTDECGQFLFGSLAPCRHYDIKVWVNDIKVRHMKIKPCDEDSCECEIEKDEEKIEEEREVIITRPDDDSGKDSLSPASTSNFQANRARPPIRRPRQP